MSDETSPRPWRVVDGPDECVAVVDASGDLLAYAAPERITADAALIVRAVNHHDELVAMVERLLPWVDVDHDDRGEVRALLARVKEKP